MKPIDLPHEAVCAFLRQHPDESLWVVHNLSDKEVSVTIPAELKTYSDVLFRHEDVNLNKGVLKLQAYGTVVLKN